MKASTLLLVLVGALLTSHALGAREMLDIQGQGLGCGQICRIGFDPSRSAAGTAAWRNYWAFDWNSQGACAASCDTPEGTVLRAGYPGNNCQQACRKKPADFQAADYATCLPCCQSYLSSGCNPCNGFGC